MPEELGGNNAPSAVNDLMTATRSINNVYNEAGVQYGDVVRRCIRCKFDQRKLSLKDDGVVPLLEEDFSDFYQLKNN